MRLAIVLSLLAACGGSSQPAPVTPSPSAPAAVSEAAPVDPVVAPAPVEPAAPIEPAAPAKILVQVDAKGVGLGGHDPIAYTKGKPAAGVAANESTHGNVTYRFATAATKTAFDAEPAKFTPQFGGYCAFAASQNRLSKSDPKVFLVHEGQLLMFTNRDFLTQFQKDAAGNKQKADANWPGLVEKHGTPAS